MRKFVVLTVLTAVVALMVGLFAVNGGGQAEGNGGIDDPGGVPLYVIIEVTWDGSSADANADGWTDSTTWEVWGPRYSPAVGGTSLTSCSDCLDFSAYSVDMKGKTMQFDEVYVPGVDATPQIRHVVLKDTDGDNVYTGSLSAQRYEFEGVWALYMDRIDYTVAVDSAGNITDFRYLEYEHKKCLDPEQPDTTLTCPAAPQG